MIGSGMLSPIDNIHRNNRLSSFVNRWFFERNKKSHVRKWFLESINDAHEC